MLVSHIYHKFDGGHLFLGYIEGLWDFYPSFLAKMSCFGPNWALKWPLVHGNDTSTILSHTPIYVGLSYILLIRWRSSVFELYWGSLKLLSFIFGQNELFRAQLSPKMALGTRKRYINHTFSYSHICWLVIYTINSMEVICFWALLRVFEAFILHFWPKWVVSGPTEP